MNCPMRLGLSNTTCLQRLREQNPIKVVFVLYDSEPNRSPSRKSPIFLLVKEISCFCQFIRFIITLDVCMSMNFMYG
jgi:hypothetical protein